MSDQPVIPAGARRYLDITVGDDTPIWRDPPVTGLPAILRTMIQEETTVVARVYDTEVGQIIALSDIAQERARQDAQWGGKEHDDQHSFQGWSALLDRHLVRLYDLLDPEDHDETNPIDPLAIRQRAVVLGALACALVETIDRNRGGEDGSPGGW